jgi:hypothetical protein
MYSDIEILRNKIDIYYSKYNTIPIVSTKYENVSNIKNLDPNDDENYYVIDLVSLDNLSLTYGQDYYTYQTTPSSNLTDLYIINERSHNVYYAKGVMFDGTSYYAEPTQSTEVTLSQILKVEIIEQNENSINIKISAVDKTNGIKKLTVMVNGSQYKTYEYSSNIYDLKTEIIQIDLTDTQRSCFVKATDSNDNITRSNTITIEKKAEQEVNEDELVNDEVSQS